MEINIDCDYKNWNQFYGKDFNHIKPNSFKSFREFSNVCSNDKKYLRTLNYGKRFIDLADRIKKLDEGFDSWQIFFLVVCAESIYRLQNNKQNERSISKSSFTRFCERNFLTVDKKILEDCFTIKQGDKYGPLTFKEITEYFYKVRCDVVHKGLYDRFHWNKSDDIQKALFIEYKEDGRIKKDTIYIKNMTYQEIRPMFIKAIIKSIV